MEFILIKFNCLCPLNVIYSHYSRTSRGANEEEENTSYIESSQRQQQGNSIERIRSYMGHQSYWNEPNVGHKAVEHTKLFREYKRYSIIEIPNYNTKTHHSCVFQRFYFRPSVWNARNVLWLLSIQIGVASQMLNCELLKNISTF